LEKRGKKGRGEERGRVDLSPVTSSRWLTLDREEGGEGLRGGGRVTGEERGRGETEQRDQPRGGRDMRYDLLPLSPRLPPWLPPSPALLDVVEAAAVPRSIPLDALGSE
jgi:hypothetical protein